VNSHDLAHEINNFERKRAHLDEFVHWVG